MLRVIAGVALILHGYPKLVHAFSWMGPTSSFPGFVQALSPFAEFFGGLALVLGVLTPIASLGIIGDMCVALFTVHFAQDDPFVAPSGYTGASYELALMYLAIAYMFLMVGPGRYSLDYLLFKPNVTSEHRPSKVPALR